MTETTDLSEQIKTAPAMHTGMDNLRKYAPRVVGGVLTGITGLAACFSLDDLVKFDQDSFFMQPQYFEMGLMGVSVIAAGVLVPYAVPRIVKRVYTRTQTALEKMFPTDADDEEHKEHNLEVKRARTNALISAGVTALAAIGAMAVGYETSPMNKQIGKVGAKADDFVWARKMQVRDNIRLLNRYVNWSKDRFADSIKGEWGYTPKNSDFLTDLPPDNLFEFKTWFSNKYCQDGSAPSLGVGDEVWRFVGFHKGSPMYSASILQGMGFMCYKGKVMFGDDAKIPAEISPACPVEINPWLCPTTMLKNGFIGLAKNGHPYEVGEPRMQMKQVDGGWEFIWDDFREFLSEQNGVAEAMKQSDGWRVTQYNSSGNKVLADLPSNWWQTK